MKIEEAKTELDRVLLAFPSYEDFLRSSDNSSGTYRLWCQMLTNCDQQDVSQVVSAIVAGDRDGHGRYEKPDTLPRNIKREANDQRSKRKERDRKFTRFDNHESLKKLRSDDERFGRYWRDALKLGTAVVQGIITPDQNADRMACLSAWHRKGGDYPFPDRLLPENSKINTSLVFRKP